VINELENGVVLESPLLAAAPAGKPDYLLAAFAGRKPPAPAWFSAAIATLPELSSVEVDGATIEALSWGTRGSPGLLLVHGNMGHARWWSHVAPLLAEARRVTAVSLSGMGGSSWRAEYSMPQFGRDALRVAEATGLFEGARPPVFVGHSAGAGAVACVAGSLGERLGGAIIVDSGIRPALGHSSPPAAKRVQPLFATLEAGLSRYRLAPPQPCANLFIADWIARHSLLQMPDRRWTWRFDPALWMSVRPTDAWNDLVRARCRLAFIRGDRSAQTPPERTELVRRAVRDDTPFITIPDAAHHVMIDQPLALVATLRAVLSCWNV
jgi:pimeloyl-ACP methyl ester carboxylesterase